MQVRRGGMSDDNRAVSVAVSGGDLGGGVVSDCVGAGGGFVGILNVNFRVALTRGGSGWFAGDGGGPPVERVRLGWRGC